MPHLPLRSPSTKLEMSKEKSSIRISKFQALLQKASPCSQLVSSSLSLDEHGDEHLLTPIQIPRIPPASLSPLSPPRTPPPLSHSPTSTPCTSAESTPSRPRSESPVSHPPLDVDFEHVRRPANPFILFACHYRKGHKGKNNRDLSREAGLMWKKLSPDDKQIWKKLAADVKAKHAEEHPGYRYKPRRRETPRRRIRFEGDLKKSRDEYSEHTLDFSSPCSSAECSPVRGKGRRVSLVPDDISFDALPPSPTKGHHDIKGRELSLFMPSWLPDSFQDSSQTSVPSPEHSSSQLPGSDVDGQESPDADSKLFNPPFQPAYYSTFDSHHRYAHHSPHLPQQYYNYSCGSHNHCYSNSIHFHTPVYDSVIDYDYPAGNQTLQTQYRNDSSDPFCSSPDSSAIYGVALGLTEPTIFTQPHLEAGLPAAVEQTYHHANSYAFTL